MIDFILWFMLIVSFLGTLLGGFLLFAVLRAVARMVEKIEEVEDDIILLVQRKADRPQPPPNQVPLERM
jgi:hypothetical protein